MKQIHPDCSLMAKEVRRQFALGQEDLARELRVSYVSDSPSTLAKIEGSPKWVP